MGHAAAGSLICLAVVAAGLVLGLAAAAPASAATVPCTYSTAGCEAQLQDVLGEELAPIEINANQLSIPSFDYVDPQSMTGADIFDYLEAQAAAQTGPDVAAIGFDLGSSAGALDVAAGSLAPETLGVSVVGAVAATYGIKLLWGTFNSSALDVVVGQAGTDYGPQWVYFPHGACNVSAWGGFGSSGIDDGNPVYVLEWSSTDFDGSTIPSSGTPAHSGDQTYNVEIPDAGSGCGIPSYPDGTTQPSTQIQGDLNAMVTAEHDASTGPCEPPNWTPTLTEDTYGIPAAFHALWYTPAEYGTALVCEFETEGPSVGSPDVTTTITAPAPATVDFGAARSFVDASPATTTGVDQALVEGGASVETQGDHWAYNGSDTVTYGPYVVPDGDTQARIYCEDSDSSTSWTSVTPGQSLTLTRTGIGGGPTNFDCYLDAAPDNSVDSETETADPNVTPNPDTFTVGTEVVPPPDGGGGSDCPDCGGGAITNPSCNVTVPPVDITPLQGLGLGTKFPFGILTWLSSVVGQLNGSGVAPSFTIPIGNKNLVVDLASANTLMDFLRPILAGFTLLSAVWFFGRATMGWGAGAPDPTGE